MTELPPETGYMHPSGHSQHLAQHEAPDERTLSITLTGPLETKDGVCWLAESSLSTELSAHAATPGLALTSLGAKMDSYYIAHGWKTVHGG